MILPFGFSVTTDPPLCSPKTRVIPPKILYPHPRAINYARSLNLNCPMRIPVTFIWDRVPPRVEPMVCRLIVHALPRCIVFPHRKPISSKREKKWACFTKIRWYTRFHWVSHGPKEARESQRTNKLWRSPLLVYPGHSTPGYLNSSKRPFPYCSKALNFKVQNLSYEKEFYLQEKRIENHNIFISKASPLLSF